MRTPLKTVTEKCTRCKSPIPKKQIIWLELSQTDGNYYKKGIPAGHKSQGFFPFGKVCALFPNSEK